MCVCVASAYSADKSSLPFTGKRFFNFYGGSGTGHSISIKKDGTTTIAIHGTSGSSTLYKGKFANPINLKDGSGWLIKDNKIFSLMNGQINKGCNGDDASLCESELSKD